MYDSEHNNICACRGAILVGIRDIFIREIQITLLVYINSI